MDDILRTAEKKSVNILSNEDIYEIEFVLNAFSTVLGLAIKMTSRFYFF